LRKVFWKSQFGIVSITIDPEHDTAKVLKEHANLLDPLIGILTVIKPTYLILLIKGLIFTQVKNKKFGGFEHSGLFALMIKWKYSLQK
jgi:protein SCO1/2